MSTKKIIIIIAAVAILASVITIGAILISGTSAPENDTPSDIHQETRGDAITEEISDTESPTEGTSSATENTPSATEPQTEEVTTEETTEDITAEIETTETEVQTTAPVYVPVTEITLTVYELELTAGHSHMPIVTMYPADATNVGEIWVSSDTTVAAVDMYGNITAIGGGQCTVTVTSADNPSVSACVTVTVTVPTETSPPAVNDVPVTGALTYIDGILVVNKTYPLPEDYNPGADAEAYAALTTMFNAAATEGISLWVKSGFRSYNDQKWQYNYYVERDGVALADTYSARPGHSEHQSGLAFDLNSLYKSFGDTPEGQWLAANCHKYGFIIRYPAGKEHLTGYMYEPWHVRYLGIEKATAVFESGLCLEEFLGITSQYQ